MAPAAAEEEEALEGWAVLADRTGRKNRSAGSEAIVGEGGRENLLSGAFLSSSAAC